MTYPPPGASERYALGLTLSKQGLLVGRDATGAELKFPRWVGLGWVLARDGEKDYALYHLEADGKLHKRLGALPSPLAGATHNAVWVTTKAATREHRLWLRGEGNTWVPYPKPVRFFQDRLMDAPEGVYLAGLSAPGCPATLSQLLPDGATRDLRCGAIGQIVPRGNAFHWFTREEGRLRGHLLFPGGHRLDVPEGMACDAAYDPANILLVRLSKAAQTAASELMLMQPGAVDEEGFVWDSTRGTLRPFGSVRGNFTFNMLRLRRDPRTHRTIAYYNHRFERLEVPGDMARTYGRSGRRCAWCASAGRGARCCMISLRASGCWKRRRLRLCRGARLLCA